jgi:DNA-binding transcriptional LysR family regulator
LLRYFVAVAEELNFTRAAARLHVAQQALSAQIKVLERELGVELLRRTTRKVELTPAGEVFLQDAREALARIERAAERARRAARGELGSLRVGHTLTAAYEALPKIIDELRNRTPDLRVYAREFYGAELLPALAEGRVDLGLAREPEPPEGLASQEIRREPWMAALSERHPLANEPEITLEALEGETVAVWPRELNPGYYDALVGAFERVGMEPETDTSPGGTSIWGEVATGRRVTLAVASLARQRPHGMALVPLRPPAPTLGLSVVWRANHLTPAARRFLEAAEAVSDAEGWLE